MHTMFPFLSLIFILPYGFTAHIACTSGACSPSSISSTWNGTSTLSKSWSSTSESLTIFHSSILTPTWSSSEPASQTSSSSSTYSSTWISRSSVSSSRSSYTPISSQSSMRNSVSSTSQYSTPSSTSSHTFSSSPSSTNSFITSAYQSSTSSALSITTSSSSSSSLIITTTTHGDNNGGGGNGGTTTTTVCCGHTVFPVIGAFLLGGASDGFADVAGSLLTIAAGVLVEIVEGDDGKPEESTISSSEMPETTTTTTTTSSSMSSSSSASSVTTASPSPYLVIPKDGTNSQQAQFESLLRTMATPNSVQAVMNVTDNSVIFWGAILTENNATKVRSNPIIDSCLLDEVVNITSEADDGPALASRNSAHAAKRKLRTRLDARLDYQIDARLELKMISRPQSSAQDPTTYYQNNQGYFYYREAGQDVTVYVLDSGANPRNPEYTDMASAPRWLTDPGDTQEDGSRLNHGSCMLSKIAGPAFGSAKKARTVVVKLQTNGRYDDDGKWIESTSQGSVLRMLDRVLIDVQAQRAQDPNYKAIVSMSFGAPAGTVRPEHLQLLHRVLSSLIRLDVVVVCASGNLRQLTHTDAVSTYPALWAYRLDALNLPLIVVGAVDNDGKRSDISQGTWELTVSASGDAYCAFGDTGSRHIGGTSPAAAVVSGAIAVFMSAPDYAQYFVPGSYAKNMQILLDDLSWSYLPNEPKCLWNGIDVTTDQCRRYKRDGTTPPQNFTCDRPDISSTTTSSTSTSTIASTTIDPTPARTAVPSPTYSNTNDYTIAWQESTDPTNDNCISFNYYTLLISYKDSAFALNTPQDWCLKACSADSNCFSTFLNAYVEGPPDYDEYLFWYECSLSQSYFALADFDCDGGGYVTYAAAWNKNQ